MFQHQQRINDENAYHQHQSYKPRITTSAYDSNLHLQSKQFNQVPSKPIQSATNRAPLSNVTNTQYNAFSYQHQAKQSVQQQPIQQQQQYRGFTSHTAARSMQSSTTAPNSPGISLLDTSSSYLMKPDQFSAPRSPGMEKLFAKDPQYCSEYAKDIYAHHKNIERKYLPPADYMNRTQHDVTDSMRAILVDWLVEVHDSFELLPDTFFLTINIIDRFLASQEVSKTKLQLVGIAALLIASKYEEISVPDVDEFIAVAANCYSRNELLHMERTILTVLEFNLTVTTPYPFLRRFLRFGRCNERVHYLSYMLTEICYLFTEYLHYAPSMLACASIYLSKKFTGSQDAWDSHLQYYSGYTESDLKPCAQMMLQMIKQQMQELQKPKDKRKYALWKKYSVNRRLKVTEIIQRSFSN